MRATRREEILFGMKEDLIKSAQALLEKLNRLQPEFRATFQTEIHELETSVHKTMGEV